MLNEAKKQKKRDLGCADGAEQLPTGGGWSGLTDGSTRQLSRAHHMIIKWARKKKTKKKKTKIDN